jgi:hypothetical protein
MVYTEKVIYEALLWINMAETLNWPKIFIDSLPNWVLIKFAEHFRR